MAYSLYPSYSFPAPLPKQPFSIQKNVSNTEGYSRLLSKRIQLKANDPSYQPLKLSIRQIRDYTSWYFFNWLNVDITPGFSSIGSKPTYLFAGGPKPNDIDIEVLTPDCLRLVEQYQMQTYMQQWLSALIHQLQVWNTKGRIKRATPDVYGCSIKPLPMNKGWLFNLGPQVQVLFKYSYQQKQGLCALDGLKVSLYTGQLSMKMGDRPITDLREFQRLMQKIKHRDIENEIIQDDRLLGRLFRILHYLAHGAKLSSQDLSLEETFQQTPSYEIHNQYVRHLENHFPTETGKLVDFLNFLTLIKDHPDRCQLVSRIIWTEKKRFASYAPLAHCILSAPQLTPYLLKFIHGALLHDLLSKNGSSSVKAWNLPFLEGEIRPFFLIDCHNMDRYLAMDCPGKKQTPDMIVLEFLHAWEHLERELPKAGFQFQDFASAFNSLGASPTVLYPDNRHRVEEEFASLSVKPHLQHYYDHFSSDQLFKTKKSCYPLFKSSLHSPRVSREAQLYAQNQLRKASVFDLCLLRQDALLRTHLYDTVKKCSSQMVSYVSAQGHGVPLLHVCSNQVHLHTYVFKALPYVNTFTPELTKKLCLVLKENYSKLTTGPVGFRQNWVKAAMHLRDPKINQKYLDFLSSGQYFKTSPLTILLQLQKQMNEHLGQAYKCLHTLQKQKKDILMLASGEKELFSQTVLKILPAKDTAVAAFIEKLIACIDKCGLFTTIEKEQIHHMKTRNAALQGLSELSSALLAWIHFRQSAFGSAFAMPLEPIMTAAQRLNSIPDEAQKIYGKLLLDLRGQTSEEQMRILHEVMPFFDFPAKEEEFFIGNRFIQFLKDPGRCQDQMQYQWKHIDRCRDLWTKTQKKKINAVKEYKYNAPIKAKIILDASALIDLFNDRLNQGLSEKIDECLVLADKQLSSKALSLFKEGIRAIVQQQRSFPDPDSTPQQVCAFIRQTTELLEIFKKFFPKKAFLRIEAIMGKFSHLSKQFPSDISALLFKAKACGLKHKPADCYHLHMTAAEFYINSTTWKNKYVEEVLEHTQEATKAVPPSKATPLQREQMIKVHSKLAILFLKRALRTFTDSPDWQNFCNYINKQLLPYLCEDTYKKDRLAAECVLDLFIAMSGIPAILNALSQIGDHVVAGNTKFSFFKLLAEYKDQLANALSEYGYKKLVIMLKQDQREKLLAHVIDMLSSFSENETDLFDRMKNFTIHRSLCKKIGFQFAFIQEAGQVIQSNTHPKLQFLTLVQIKHFLGVNENLLEWDTWCNFQSTGQKDSNVLLTEFYDRAFNVPEGLKSILISENKVRSNI